MRFELKKIEDIALVKGGKRLPKGKMLLEKKTKHPYIRLVDIKDNLVNENNIMYLDEETFKSISNYIVEKDDVCLAIVGHTIGLVFYIDSSMDGANLTENAVKLKFNDDVNPRFVYYYLISQKGHSQILSRKVGSAQGKLPIYNVKNIEIELPDKQNQDKIVSILNALDEKFYINRSIIENLEEMAQILFKRWFIDFEFPNEEGLPYKSSGGKMIDSELGEIPEGWEVSYLDKIANYKNGLAMQKYRPIDGELDSLPVLKIKELNQGYVSNNSERCSSTINEDVKVYNGDVVFSWSGTLLVKLWTGGNAGLNQHLFKVTSNEFEKWFYYLWSSYHLGKFKAIAADKATTMGHIKRTHLAESEVFVANKEIMDSATKILKPLIEHIIVLGIENKRLSELRNLLLPKLLSGEIKIPDESVVG